MSSPGRRAVFLDRDGTVSRYVEYCRRPEEFELLPGAGEAIRRLNQAGMAVAVVTNQSAIGRGWLAPETLEQIHEKMRRQLAQAGASVDAVYVCPHHPDDGCACRKPNTGMLEGASRELGISLESSYVIGDRLLDVRLGRGAGSTTILVRTGHPPESLEGVAPDYEAATLQDAVTWVLAREAARAPTQKTWAGRYRAMTELLYAVRRRCPRQVVLGMSLLNPRHPLPPDQARLLEGLRRVQSSEFRVEPGRSTPGLLWRGIRLMAFAARDTVRLALLKWEFGSVLRWALREPASVVLKTWAFGPETWRGPSDFYYGTLPQQLGARGVRCVLLCGDARSRIDPAFTRAFLQRRDIRAVPEWLLVPLWAPLVTACRQLAAALALRRLAVRSDDVHAACADRLACLGSLEPGTMRNTLHFDIARAAVKRWTPRAFVALYEGQPWELPSRHGVKAADPQCLTVGYQHTILMPYAWSVLAPSHGSWELSAPDFILCLGEITRRMMTPGHASLGTRFVTFGTFRRDGKADRLSTLEPGRRTVLVLPEGNLPESKILFAFAMRSAEAMPDHQFVFRCHPLLPFDQVRPHLDDAPERHPNVELSRRPSIAEDFDRASVVLYRGSSAVLYAVLRGLKPCYLHEGQSHDIDPLFELTTWRERITSVEGFAATLRPYAAMSAPAAEEAWRRAAEYVNAYTQPVDDAAVGRFLAAIGLAPRPDAAANSDDVGEVVHAVA